MPAILSNVTVNDDYGRAGNQAQAMRNGTAILCKMPDGSERYCQIDAERSTPGGPVYLLPL